MFDAVTLIKKIFFGGDVHIILEVVKVSSERCLFWNQVFGFTYSLPPLIPDYSFVLFF